MNQQPTSTVQDKPKVSHFARLVSAATFLVPSLGALWSLWSLLDIVGRVEVVKGVGVEVVIAALAEASLPALIALYATAFFGLIVVVLMLSRALMETKKCSPPFWFFLISGFLFLLPVVAFFEASSVILEVLISTSSTATVTDVAANSKIVSIMGIIFTPLLFLVFVVISVVPWSRRSNPKWSALIGAVLVEFLILIAILALQWRVIWLYSFTSGPEI